MSSNDAAPAHGSSTQLELVTPCPAHAPLWAAWRAQKDAQAFNPFALHTLELLEQRLELMAGGFVPGVEDAGWIAEVDGTAAGLFALRVNWRMMTATVGYHLDASVHRRGLGTALVRLGLERVWQESDIRKVTATIHAGNVASKRVVEKTGFHHEGTRQREWVINDTIVDVEAYAVFRPK